MLFHVTMTHSPDNCPVNLPPDEQKKFFADLEDVSKELLEAGKKIIAKYGTT